MLCKEMSVNLFLKQKNKKQNPHFYKEYLHKLLLSNLEILCEIFFKYRSSTVVYPSIT